MHEKAGQWEAAGDSRSEFLRCYAFMTGNMLHAVETSRFEDCSWVNRLLHLFADYYFIALEQYETDAATSPAVWRHAHDSTLNRRRNVLQNLLLGINAHINYDLALALRDMLAPEWTHLTETQRQSRYRDHRLVNTIIAETIDIVQDEVVEKSAPGMDVIDKIMGRLDERLLSGLITRWRENVWNDGLSLLLADDPETERLRIEAKTLKRAELMVWI